jgi:hypothetical protein
MFVVVAYLLSIPAVVAGVVATRRTWTCVYGAFPGPVLTLAVSAACVWVARFRLPPSEPHNPPLQSDERVGPFAPSPVRR